MGKPKLNKDDYIGKTYTNWTVKDVIVKQLKNGKFTSYFVCECKCGKIKEVYYYSVTSGDSQSCGCLYKDLNGIKTRFKPIHGLTNTRIYKIWQGIYARCYCPSKKNSKYQKKQIRICEEWHDFQNFYNWSIANGYDEKAPRGKCTIERIDNDGDYCPENCVWETMSTQQRNKDLMSNNKSGENGIAYYPNRGKNGYYSVSIGVDGSQIYLGGSTDLEKAKKLRKDGEIKYWGKG